MSVQVRFLIGSVLLALMGASAGCSKFLKPDSPENSSQSEASLESGSQVESTPPPSLFIHSQATHGSSIAARPRALALEARGYIESRNQIQLRITSTEGLSVDSLAGASIRLLSTSSGLSSQTQVFLEGDSIIIDDPLFAGSSPDHFCLVISGLRGAAGGVHALKKVSFARLTGDLNADGVVDSSDQAELGNHFGSSVLGESASDLLIRSDLDLDGSIGASDFGSLLALFGSQLSGSSPEECL